MDINEDNKIIDINPVIETKVNNSENKTFDTISDHKKNIDKLFCIESWICSICHDPLLDPVVAEDGILYNKKCILKYCEFNNNGKKFKSPITKQIISKNFMKIFHIRSCVLTLITDTNIFDTWLSDLTIDQITHYNLTDILINSTKMNLLNDKLKIDLVNYVAVKFFESNKYQKAIELLNKHNQNSNISLIWIYACENNLSKTALKILESNQLDLNYNYVTDSGMNGLLFACKNKMNNVVLKLLEKSDLNITYLDNDENDAFLLLCINNMTDVCSRFIELRKDINFNTININGLSPLIVCCKNKMSNIALKILEKDYSEYNRIDNFGNNSLSWACHYKLYDVCIALLNKTDIECNFVDEGIPVFSRICNCDNYDLMVIDEFLKKSDLNYNSVSIISGNTALINACLNKNTNIALKILDMPNVNIDHINNSGYCALFFACENGMIEVIKKMLSHNLNYNLVKQKTGETALIIACKNNYEDIAMLLLKLPSINYKIADNKDVTAFSICKKNKLNKVIDDINNLDNSIDRQNKNEFTKITNSLDINKIDTNIKIMFVIFVTAGLFIILPRQKMFLNIIS